MDKRCMAIIGILLVGLMALLALWLACRGDLRECKDKLQECQAAPAFRFLIDLDSYGTFMPLNNQFDEDPLKNLPPEVFRGGYFVQLGNFEGANHSYNRIILEHANGSETEYARANEDVAWIDVICGSKSDPPIDVENARLLVPEDDADDSRLIHDDLVPENLIVLATLWGGPNGMTATTKTEAALGLDHGHDEYSLSSMDTCTVRVWKSLEDASPAKVFDATDPTHRVIEIRVLETGLPSTHGGPHYPPWYTQPL